MDKNRDSLYRKEDFMKLKKLFSLLCAAAVTLSAVGGLPAAAEPNESAEEETIGKSWQADFKYNEETGVLSWDPCEEAEEYIFGSKGGTVCSYVGRESNKDITWVFYSFRFSFGSGSFGETEVVLPLELAGNYFYHNISLTGDLTFSLDIYDSESCCIYQSADTFDYHYDGCNLNSSLAVPKNLKAYPQITWDSVDGAIGYLVEVVNSSNSEDVHYYTASNETFSTTGLTLEETSLYQVSVCSVDKNGNRSEWSEPIEIESKKWTANFKYNEETGVLSWDLCEKAEKYYSAKKESYDYYVQETGTYTDFYSTTRCFDEETETLMFAPEVYLPLKLAQWNCSGNSLTGDLTFRLYVPVSGESSYNSADRFTYHYDGCDLNPSLGVPSNIWNFTEKEFEYSGVENAIGYIVRYTGSDGIVHHSSNINETWSPWEFWVNIDEEWAAFPDGDYTFEVCAIDNKGDRSEWSKPVTFNVADKKFTNIPLTYPKNITINAAGDLIWEASGATGYTVFIRGENVQLTERTTEKALKDLTEVLKNQADGDYTITVTAFNDNGIERTGETLLTFTKVSDGFFKEENKKESAAVTADEAEKETAAAIPADDKVESVTINPAFNLQLKEEALAAVGELDLEKIEIKAKEIFSKEPIEKAKEAIARKLADGEGNSDSENRQVILMDLSLWHGSNDISEQYEGLVQVSISIPKNHLGKEISLWRLNDNNGIIESEEIEGEISEDGKSYIVYLEHFSEYALVADGGEIPAPEKQGFCSDGSSILDAEIGTTVTQKTEVKDGKYNVRFVQKVNADTLAGKSKATFTLTANGVTKEVSTTKYYTGLTFDDGTKATAASGQVFLCYTVTGVPENVTVEATNVVLE